MQYIKDYFTKKLDIIFEGDLLDVKADQVIAIGGKILPNANRVNINICSGHLEKSLIAVHLSWRHNENIIVRNTFNSKWGAEEREHNRDKDFNNNNCGLSRGSQFIVQIKVLEELFKIFINGELYCSFCPLGVLKSTICKIFVEGDCKFFGLGQLNGFPSFDNPKVLPYIFSLDFPCSGMAHTFSIIATQIVNSNGNLKILLRPADKSEKPIPISLSAATLQILPNGLCKIVLRVLKRECTIEVNGCQIRTYPLSRDVCGITIIEERQFKIHVSEVKHI